jgi:hypothetical protein
MLPYLDYNIQLDLIKKRNELVALQQKITTLAEKAVFNIPVHGVKEADIEEVMTYLLILRSILDNIYSCVSLESVADNTVDPVLHRLKKLKEEYPRITME